MGDWSELPYDLVEKITGFLQLTDYHRFASVCRSWSYVATNKFRYLAAGFPLLLIYDDESTTQMFLSLCEQKFYNVDLPQVRNKCCFGSSYGFLATIDWELETQLLDPFSGAQIALPRLPPYFPGDEKEYDPRPNYPRFRNCYLARLVLSADPRTTADYVVMAIYGYHRWLAFWRPGDATWIKVEQENGRRLREDEFHYFEDVIWYEGAFYAVTVNSFVFVVDIGPNPSLRQVMPQFRESFCSDLRYLVEVKGRLYFVARGRDFRDKTIGMIVVTINLKQQKWHRVHRLRGSALFLGYNASFSVDARDIPGCRDDYIYFAQDAYNGSIYYGYDGSRQGPDCRDQGIFDYKNHSMASSFYPPNTDVSSLPLKHAPVWLTPSPW